MKGLLFFLVMFSGAILGFLIQTLKYIKVSQNISDCYTCKTNCNTKILHTKSDLPVKNNKYRFKRFIKKIKKRVRKAKQKIKLQVINKHNADIQRKEQNKQAKHETVSSGTVLLNEKIQKEEPTTVEFECAADGIDKKEYIKQKMLNENDAYNVLKNKKE